MKLHEKMCVFDVILMLQGTLDGNIVEIQKKYNLKDLDMYLGGLEIEADFNTSNAFVNAKFLNDQKIATRTAEITNVTGKEFKDDQFDSSFD